MIDKYIQLCSWYFIKEGDKDITSDQFSAVLKEIGVYETKLKESGMSGEQMDELIKKIKKNTLEKTVGEMSDSELLKTCKLIFGNEVEFEGGYTP
jgi:ribosomal protein L12E/L44/L45/RPP1/RPP2